MAVKPGSRQLSWLPNNLFDTGGMPAWLATAFDTDERRAEFTKWMGDMFAQWTRGQNVNTEANAASVVANKRWFMSTPGTGRYFSQRQLEEVFEPESKADRLARIGFHGGMANGKWTNDYDVWKAAGGKSPQVKSFGFRVPTSRDQMVPELEKRGWGERAQAWAGSSSRASGGDYRGVRLAEDGSLQFTFGNDRTSERLAARQRIKQLNEENRGWLFDGPETNFSDRDRFVDLFAASKGGDTMRERGWLDAVFNGGLTRAALHGGRARK